MKAQQNTEPKETKGFHQLMYRYIPYWPLFILLFLVFAGIGWLYIYFATPLYEIKANILIKDEKKGSDNPRGVENLNVYASKKIVENEVEVIQSRELMGKIVNGLHLYAPVYEAKFPSAQSAYTSSPVKIVAQQPGAIVDQEKIKFSYDPNSKKVIINNSAFPLDKWVTTIYGTLRFVKNNDQVKQATHPLYFSLINPGKVANELQKQLDVSQSSKLSTVITLKIKDEVPQRGKEILNNLIDVYNNADINEKNQLATKTMALVDNRLHYVGKELDSIERRIQKYKSQNNVTDLSEQGKVFLQNVSDNERKLSSISTQLAVLDQVEKLMKIKDGQSAIAPSALGTNDPVLTQLLQKLYDSEMQYEKLKKTTPTGNPMMYSLKNEIENIKPIILDNIQTQKISLLASKNDLNMTNGMYVSKIKTIPEQERQLVEISRQQAFKNDAYSFLLQKREETALSYASSVPDSRIVDWAAASNTPVSPKRMLIYFGSFILAMITGIGYVNSKELLSDKVLFRSEIESMATIPVVAEIMKVKGKQPLVINNVKQVFVAEQFRQLRASIGLFGREIKNKKILITSNISGEGKSFISTNLALSLALSGKKVLLVDMDLRKPRTSEIFDLSNNKGVAEFLLGECSPNEIIYKTSYNNLYVMPAGYVDMNTTELLLSGHVDELIKSIQNSFDVLIIDAAPVDPVMDAFVLSEYCDATLLVIRHRYTPKTMIHLLDDNHKIKVLKNIGIVFNCVRQRGFVKKGYGFGYGYGYMNVYGSYTTKELSNKIEKPAL